MNRECNVCNNLSGSKNIFKESRIYDGKYWAVEHAYPCKIKGWLVLILKNHKEQLHELNESEFKEFSELVQILTKSIYKETNCGKEYLIFCSDSYGKGFDHLHAHLIGRPKSLAIEKKGGKIFELIKINEKDSISKKELILFSNKFKKTLNNIQKKWRD